MIIPNKIELANLPTPIHAIFFEGFEILIKRDDFTGTEWTGNKIRKLEFLAYDALEKNAQVLITCGGIQSNHARATACVSARLGMKCLLYLRGKEPKNADGNLAMSKLFGAEIIYVTQKEYDNIESIAAKKIKKLSEKKIKAYFIPEGGSSEIGIWGYINFVKELQSQLKEIKNKPSHIITAVGSGGTLAGLILGKKLFNLKSNLVGVNVLKTRGDFEKIVVELANKCSKKFRLGVKVSSTDFEILDGYSSEGYENITNEKLKLLTTVSSESGILFDPAYTGKAFYGMIDHFIYKGNEFNRLMFLHTGGIFGVFAKTKQYIANIIQ
ncbi:MAG: pyridoxal-phosphate dependent enzyme [Ignavibacteria bacterium]|nr:pyridoxal-phosphate dependent enzyme [Ignavibacteria bacterium]